MLGKDVKALYKCQVSAWRLLRYGDEVDHSIVTQLHSLQRIRVSLFASFFLLIMISNFSHIVSIEHQVPWPTAVDLPLSLGTPSQDTAQRVLLRLTRTYSSLLICIALVLFASCYSTRHSLKQTRLGPREVKGTVPLLSHVIGLVLDPFEYPKTLA